MNTRISRGGQAFDAAGSAGLGFLTSNLALIDPVVTRPLSAQTYERDIDIRYGGGFGPSFINAWAANYAAPGGGQLGLQGTNNTDTPMVQVDLQEGTWKSYLWSQGFIITYYDLQKIEFASRNGMQPPINFQDLYNNAIQATFDKAMDRVTYLGWAGQPGLVNNPAVAATTVVGGVWSAATPSVILAAVNTAIGSIISNSVYDLADGMPNRMLIPWSVWAFLSQPMTTAGSISTIEYIEKSNIATTAGTQFKMLPIPDPWVATQGVGSTKRIVVYRKDTQAVDLFVPQPVTQIMTLPTAEKGGAYQTLFGANVGQLRWKRPQTALYVDGV
jgi:hypothetical protein